jgi:hypothetical protein
MNAPGRRIADLEVIARSRQPEQVPVWCFFHQDLFQARANYGSQPPDVVLADIEGVERIIRTYDEMRSTQHLDLIDVAILIQREVNPHHAQTASSVAGSIVQAIWNWDKERYGEDKAWRQQRSRGEFEGQVAARLVGLATS